MTGDVCKEGMRYPCWWSDGVLCRGLQRHKAKYYSETTSLEGVHPIWPHSYPKISTSTPAPWLGWLIRERLHHLWIPFHQLQAWVVCICFYLFTCSCSVVVSSSLRPHGLQPTRLLPGKNTGMGCYFLLLGIFQTQGLNLSLLHWQVDSLPQSTSGAPDSYFNTLISEAYFKVIQLGYCLNFLLEFWP